MTTERPITPQLLGLLADRALEAGQATIGFILMCLGGTLAAEPESLDEVADLMERISRRRFDAEALRN